MLWSVGLWQRKTKTLFLHGIIALTPDRHPNVFWIGYSSSGVVQAQVYVRSFIYNRVLTVIKAISGNITNPFGRTCHRIVLKMSKRSFRMLTMSSSDLTLPPKPQYVAISGSISRPTTMWLGRVSPSLPLTFSSRLIVIRQYVGICGPGKTCNPTQGQPRPSINSATR